MYRRSKAASRRNQFSLADLAWTTFAICGTMAILGALGVSVSEIIIGIAVFAAIAFLLIVFTELVTSSLRAERTGAARLRARRATYANIWETAVVEPALSETRGGGTSPFAQLPLTSSDPEAPRVGEAWRDE